jgi:nitrous oxidase accessory protein NosD
LDCGHNKSCRPHRPLRENFWKLGNATVSTLFPVLSGEFISDISIENLTLDGNKSHNDNLDGNYAGCIFLQDCSRIAIRGVQARNYNGDGISWQICHDVIVENCVSENHAGLGLHPGSGSQRPIIRNCRLEGNDIGIFFCWGVKYGLAENNQLIGNRVGVSIGHRDTDNLVTSNEILQSRQVGVLFRPERGKDFAGHRNRIENNRIVDSGSTNGVAIDVQGATEAVVLSGNEIIETRQPADRIAVRLGAETKAIQVQSNQITGFVTAVKQLSEPPPR